MARFYRERWWRNTSAVVSAAWHDHHRTVGLQYNGGRTPSECLSLTLYAGPLSLNMTVWQMGRWWSLFARCIPPGRRRPHWFIGWEPRS